jgi:hypothetical protein
VLGATGGGGVVVPAVAQAAIVTLGPPLLPAATLDTASDLGYAGTDIPTISGGQAVVVHVSHDGADTALWNATLPQGQALVPADGQITSLSLEGCAESAPGGPAPLTQIHFQALSPAGGGAFMVALTTNAFDIPVCGQGTSPATVTSYTPQGYLCVQAGDAVAFDDEGGFDPSSYPSGVPYEVMGPVSGAVMGSFIMGGGLGNGALISPQVVSAHNGYAANAGEELLLDATLATGPDASPVCGGTLGVTPPPPPLSLPAHQRDGVTARGTVAIALYCSEHTACSGTISLHAGRLHGTGAFTVAPKGTGHVVVRLSRGAVAVVRRAHEALRVAVVATGPGGARASGTVTLTAP